MASVIATGRHLHSTVWYFSPFHSGKERGALHLDGGRQWGRGSNAGEKAADLQWLGLQVPDIQVSHTQTPRVSSQVFWGEGCGGVGMSSLHSVTYRGNVSSKRACVWDLEILLWSGMLVVKTTGCEGIWPSLGYRGIIGWFHTKVNCSNVKSGKRGLLEIRL